MPKQGQLAGTMSPENAKIEALAFDYVEVRDKRMDLNKEEIARRDDLIEAMRDAGVETYSRGNVNISLEEKTKVKVRIKDEGGEEEE